MTSQTNFFKEWRPERDRSISEDQPFENQHQRTSKESVKKHLEDPWINFESIMTPQNVSFGITPGREIFFAESAESSASQSRSFWGKQPVGFSDDDR